MTPSPLNACVCIFFLIYWNSCILPGNAAELQRRFWLGCRVRLPCPASGPSAASDSFKWFYVENEHSKAIQLYFQNKNGIAHYNPSRTKVEVMFNRSLVINNFTAKDQGIYWCENCHQDNCMKEPSSFIHVQREIMKEIPEKMYILSGSRFTYACPGEFANLKWTFEDSITQRTSEVSTNKTLHIGSVKSTNAGNYTCWASSCGGQSQKLLIINLCVITVHRVHSNLSCAVHCDVGLDDLKNISSLLKGNQTISVDLDSSGSLICNLNKSLEGHLTTTSSYSSSVTSNTTIGVSKKHGFVTPVIYGILPVFIFFIFLAFLALCLKSRIRAAFPFHLSSCGFTGEAEEDSTVIYSSVIIRTPPNTRNQHKRDDSCVYSELNV